MLHLIDILSKNNLIKIFVILVLLDIFMGVCRAVKERKFNSTIGIDGAIRKVAMIGCITFLVLLDACSDFNLLFVLPENLRGALNIGKVGLSDFFALLFALCENASILKNMSLCGLPVGKKWQEKLNNLLEKMTDEMPTTNKNDK